MKKRSMLTRREFISSAAASFVVARGLSATNIFLSEPERRRLTILASDYSLGSDAQKIGDRFLAGYPLAGRWRQPLFKVESVYIAQNNDSLIENRAAKFSFRTFSSISEALNGGGSQLASEAVLLFSSHPQDDLFEKTLQTLAARKKPIPIFCAGPLAGSFKEAQSRIDLATSSGIPLMSGSWLPVTRRLPQIDIPFGAPLKEALVVVGGNFPQMEYHALEGLQSVVERRKGGETGIHTIRYFEGSQVWDAYKTGQWSHDLLSAALSRTDTPQGLSFQDSRTQDISDLAILSSLVKSPEAFVLEYNDGVRATLLLLNGAICDFNFSANIHGADPISFQFFVSVAPNATYAASLAAKIEQMFHDGKAPYPIERSLITSGVLETCTSLRSSHRPYQATPHLAVSYQAPSESQYMRV